jgi:hypothetical protein
MNKIIFICLILACACKQQKKSAAPKFQTSPDSLITKINFHPNIWDADTIVAGSKIEGVFVLYNSGKNNLQITKVKSPCNCTAAFSRVIVKTGRQH